MVRLVPLEVHDVLYLVNPGSVGQPRDGDPRAAYLVCDTAERSSSCGAWSTACGKVQEKIVLAGLPDVLAERLETGT